MANTNPDSPDFIPSKSYIKDTDKPWDTTYYVENPNGGLIALDAHFTGKEDQNYSNTYAVVVQ